MGRVRESASGARGVPSNKNPITQWRESREGLMQQPRSVHAEARGRFGVAASYRLDS